MNGASADYIRVCPVCGAEHPPEDTQCACGTLLIGVDLALRGQAAPSALAVKTAPATATLVCPYADCGAANPPGQTDCAYCGRPLQAKALVAPANGLYNLPAALRDNFDIERVLPAGGAEAELMLLKGRKTGVRVMAKLYRPGIAPKGEVLERVAGVARAHVVRLIAHGVSDGVAYEVMEYCSGGSLRDLMSGGALGVQRIRAVVREIAEALAALHACRVIHRDLKPENVLVRRADPLDLVLTDFGIASLQDATQLFTGTARTARYGAPEAMSGVLDEAADYWSLGMILVELLRGEHPFAGLSDAVIAHRLATANVDTSDVADPAWRQLCRGLLQRDPARRWGIAEIRRWLTGDTTLPEIVEAPTDLAHPYRLEGEECRNTLELALALTRRWQAGAKDLARGQLQSWARDELKDHDLVRFLQDLQEASGSADLHLFRLIRHLAPGIPPAWRGSSLAPESILAMAVRAGDDQQAAAWLDSVFSENVLAALAADAYPALAALDARWREVSRQFVACWQQADEALGAWRQGLMSRGEVAFDFDALVYGHSGGLKRPPAGLVHGALLLALEQEPYRHDLRTRVLAEAVANAEHSPWLAAFCDRSGGEDAAAIAALVAVQYLLPQARQASEEGGRSLSARREEQADRFGRLHAQVNDSLAALRGAADDLRLFFAADSRRRLATRVDEFLALANEARGLVAATDVRGEPVLRAVARAEPLLLGIRDRLDEWESADRINALWRDQRVINGVVGSLFVLVVFGSRWLSWVLIPLGALAAFAAWRVWILAHHRSAIRQLAAGLPLRLASPGR